MVIQFNCNKIERNYYHFGRYSLIFSYSYSLVIVKKQWFKSVVGNTFRSYILSSGRAHV